MYKVFKNDIYPFCLIVGKMDDIDAINEEYETWDREDLEPHKNSEATTYAVYRKGTNYAAICVLFNVTPTIRLIAHESLHITYIVLDILCYISLNDTTDECYAYLIGWVAEKINECKEYLNKQKEHGNMSSDSTTVLYLPGPYDILQ